MKIDASNVSAVAPKLTDRKITGADLTAGFGMVVRELRKKKSVTQEELAKAVGLERTSISNIENGKQVISTHHLMAIADFLGVDVYVQFHDKAKASSLSTALMPMFQPLIGDAATSQGEQNG